jgi:CHASE1-domain containing sensor protein
MIPGTSQTHTGSRHGRGLARFGLPIAVMLVGAVLSSVLCLIERSRTRDARRHEFDQHAAQLAARAEDSFDTPLEVLRSIPAFYAASEEVTRAEFRAFVKPALDRYPWIYALEWIPRVPGSEREAYEAAAKNDGIADFHFKQDAPSGPPVIAETRPEYFPLYFMEPLNPIPLGIEETALPARQRALELARDTGSTAVSERLQLVQDEPGVASVIAFHPIYQQGRQPTDVESRRASLRGFAAAVFRISPVLTAALKRDGLSAFDLVVTDMDAQPPCLLYESLAGAQSAQRNELTWQHVATVAGRQWSFRVGDRAGVVRAGTAGLPILIIGLLISALIAALATALRSALHLRRQVEAARRLGQYTLVEKLGQGGMGTVYRARHAMLQRPTAIKLLDPLRTDPATLARFESEVRLTSSLSHPNTIVVYDYGHSPDGIFYYSMEYIDGISLQTLVDADGPQPPGRVVPLLLQIASALSEAHEVGLVHRDVKPANIMLCNRGGILDFVKVLDFGLVKDLVHGDNKLSQSTTFVGTPLYLAPELVANRSIDARADLYAVGAVAYFLLTGTPVFTGKTTVEVCAKHLSLAPESPSVRLGHPIPADLEALILECLQKDPAHRPASAAALVERLRKLNVVAWEASQALVWWAAIGNKLKDRLNAERRTRMNETHGLTLEIDRHNV